jgi:hypothetical protein
MLLLCSYYCSVLFVSLLSLYCYSIISFSCLLFHHFLRFPFIASLFSFSITSYLSSLSHHSFFLSLHYPLNIFNSAPYRILTLTFGHFLILFFFHYFLVLFLFPFSLFLTPVFLILYFYHYYPILTLPYSSLLFFSLLYRSFRQWIRCICAHHNRHTRCRH